MNNPEEVSLTAKLRLIAAKFPGEIASLLCLDRAETISLLSQAISENPDTAARVDADGIGESLRELTGLSEKTSLAITSLTNSEEAQFEEVIESMLQQHLVT